MLKSIFSSETAEIQIEIIKKKISTHKTNIHTSQKLHYEEIIGSAY